MRTLVCVVLIGAACLAQSPELKQVTWTGWFADAGCGNGRFSSAAFTPPNPECAKQCIQKGIAPIFLSEQARTEFQVKGYSGVVENLGYRLEVTGKVDDAAKIISITSVKRISEYQGPACARPKKRP